MKKRRPGATSASLKRYREAMGLSFRAASAAWGVNAVTLSQFEAHEPAPNHPTLAKIAERSGIPLDELTRGNAAPLLDDAELALVRNGMNRGGKPRKLAAHTAAPSTTAVVVPRGKVPSAKALAQTLRTMVTSHNVARMQGEKVVPIPVAQLGDFLSAVLVTSGKRAEDILIRADFAELFG